jgi:hypothetical protein
MKSHLTIKQAEKYFLNNEREWKHGYIHRVEEYVNERRGMCDSGMSKWSKAQVSRMFFPLLL